MLNYHGYNQRMRKLARLAAAWFIIFAIAVPAFHRHASEFAPGAFAVSAVHSAANSAPAIHKAVRLVQSGDDDCPLCQWFSVGFTPPSSSVHLFVRTTSTPLILSVRLLALCQRPVPRRGLRGPPAFCA